MCIGFVQISLQKNIKHILNAVLNPAMCRRQRYTHSEFILWYSQYVKGKTASAHFYWLPTCSCIKYHCWFSHLEGNTDYALSEILCKRTRCTKSVKRRFVFYFFIYIYIYLFVSTFWVWYLVIFANTWFSYTPGCHIPLIVPYTLIVIYPWLSYTPLFFYRITCSPVMRSPAWRQSAVTSSQLGVATGTSSSGS